MTVRTIDDIFRDFVIDGVPASGPFHPYKPDIRDTLKALLEGISAFPDNRVIRLNNGNEGSPNNIVVSASVAIPAAAYQVLYILNVTQENTGPVTVSGAINRALVTNTNRPIETGYLKPGMALLCIDTGTELRLLSYGDAEAIQEAAEEAAARAEAAANSLNLPTIQPGDAGKSLVVNPDEDGYELGSPSSGAGEYESRAKVEETNIPETANFIRTAGYYAPGDGGGALYKRVSTEPVHAGKVQSADGAWWELAETIVTPFMFGAKGDLVADDADAINNCFAYFKLKNCSCHIPSPKVGYAISKSLKVYLTADYDASWLGYRGKQISIDKGARFKATAAMYAMIQVGDVDWSGVVRDGIFEGGVFDCNDLASVGFFAPFYELLRVNNVTVWNYNDAGFVLGALATPGSSYEGMLRDCNTNRKLAAAPNGSVSVRWNRGGDNHMFDCLLKGHHTAGVAGNGTWTMKLVGVHCWNNAEHGDAQYGFVLQGGNQLIGCQVDNPVSVASYRFEQPDNSLIGSNVTKDSGGVGGAFVDLATNATVIAMGCKIVATGGNNLLNEVIGYPQGYASIGNHVSGISTPATSNRRVQASGPVGTGSYTVATLPTVRQRGDRAFVTDASNGATFGAVVTGGASGWCPVVFNGSNWIVG